MKTSNIATVVLVAVISTVVAALMVNALLGDPNEESVSVRYMDVVSADVEQPDAEVFNTKAVNPTVEVYVGNCADGELWDDELQVCVNQGENGGTETEPDETEQ